MPPTPEQVKQRLDVDEVKTASQLGSTLGKLLSDKSTTLYTLHGVSLPKDVTAAGKTDITALLPALAEARTVKTAGEIALMRRASEISSQAHADVMEAVGRGDAKSERDGDAIFRASCLRAGARHQAYQSIVAVGPHASTLHYIDNSAPFPEKALLLLDAGAEYDGYAADITRTMPVGNGGRFTEDAGAIYDIVLRMQDEALAMIKAGVDWKDVHLRAHQVAARGLLELGILHAEPSSAQGDALVDELVAKGATLWAFPHGLGCVRARRCTLTKQASPRSRRARRRWPTEWPVIGPALPPFH